MTEKTIEQHRKEFEDLYERHFEAHMGRKMNTPVIGLREKDSYGSENSYLNGMWHGFKLARGIKE